jgi:ribosomal-protein-alanine N-acetyltransferase
MNSISSTFFSLADYNLRQLKSSDSVAYLRYMNNDQVKEYLADGLVPSSLEDSRKYIDFYKDSKSYCWGIARKTNDLLIGTIGFNFISTVHKKAEIGFDLDCDYWGKNIMSESLSILIDFAKSIHLVRLQATVLEGNLRSIKTLEKAGFQKEGLLKQYESNIKNQNSILYAVILN